jgi:hypothetical protein
VPQQNRDRIGVLVVRASVEQGHGLVVQLLDVEPARPERVIGIADDPATACRLLKAWLETLVATSEDDLSTPDTGGDPR